MHRPLNVGCTLQAYATCEVMRRLGHDASIIDYWYPNERHHQDGMKRRLLHILNEVAGWVFTGGEFNRRKKRYDDFLSKYLPMSRPFATYHELKTKPPKYDVYCAGSDQIWNPAFIRDDDSFLCGFVPDDAKLISYASSFGCSSLNEEQRAFYKEHLSRFDFVSTREQQGVRIIEKELGLKTARCLDPTLLLDCEYWTKLAESIPTRMSKPSIVIYGASAPCGETEALAKRLARQNNWQIVRIHGRPWQKWTPGFCYRFDIGPLEFLDCFSHAKCILTTTFHGTAFAINFGVPFYSLMEHDSKDTRISDLLELLGLKTRLLDFGQGARVPNVSFLGESYKEKLKTEREHSIEYLSNALS